MQAARDGSDELSGVVGLLGELVAVPATEARAVDAALGALAGAVVVKNEGDLRVALDFLRAEPRGPATFLVLDRPGPTRDAADGPGAPLVDVIEGDDDVADLLRSLLATARIADDEEQLLAELGSGRFLLTRDGMKLDRSGAFSDRPQKRALGFVERKVERDELTAELDTLRDDLRRLGEEEARLSAEVAEWTARVAESERRKREVEEGILETRSAEERLHDKATIFRRELRVSAHERYEVECEATTVAAGRQQSSEALRDSRRSREFEEARRRDLVDAGREAAEDLARLAEESNAAAAEVIRYRERVQGAESEIVVVERVVQEQEEGVRAIHVEREELAERATRAAADAAELVERLAGLQSEEEELEESLAGFVQQEQEFLSAVDARRRGGARRGAHTRGGARGAASPATRRARADARPGVAARARAGGGVAGHRRAAGRVRSRRGATEAGDRQGAPRGPRPRSPGSATSTSTRSTSSRRWRSGSPSCRGRRRTSTRRGARSRRRSASSTQCRVRSSWRPSRRYARASASCSASCSTAVRPTSSSRKGPTCSTPASRSSPGHRGRIPGRSRSCRAASAP